MIHTKLLEFQKLNIKVSKVGENPHFNSNFATLNEVLDKVKKPLNDLNILIIQTPEQGGLRTILLDTEDNTKVECFMPYTETSSAQKLGSNNTYLRRYSLVTLLGLEDKDDDGNDASIPTPVRSQTVQKTQGDTLKGLHGKAQVKAEHALVNAPQCLCGEPSKKVLTKKEGLNKGRFFFACDKGQNDPMRCTFFKWESEVILEQANKVIDYDDVSADEMHDLNEAEAREANNAFERGREEDKFPGENTI